MVDLKGLSFGTPAAIVTSMGLIVGLDAATAAKATVIGSLLIVALADNLTDSLSVHIYQESEQLTQPQALQTTVANFIARLLTSLTFVLMFYFLPTRPAILICVAWGFLLLSALSYLLARARGAASPSEILKHDGVAVMVIGISKVIGSWIHSVV